MRKHLHVGVLFVLFVLVMYVLPVALARGEETTGTTVPPIEPTTTVVTTDTAAATQTVVATPTPDPLVVLHKKKCGGKKDKWKGSHKQWDKIALQTLKDLGLTKRERREAMSIHHREGGPNSINAAGRCYGGWQLSWGMAHGKHWWCPKWETKRAVRYMRGRYGSIHKAYLFKNANGWY